MQQSKPYNNKDLERAKKVMLKLLIEFDRICNKHNITYWIDYGTLLGAVRHKGFIPWDDDIDVSMPREDYNKLKKIIQKELPNDMFFQTKNTDPDFYRHFAKIRDLNSKIYRKYYLGKYDGIFLDIFPLDIIKEKHVKWIKTLKLYYHITPFRKWPNDRSNKMRKYVHILLSPILLLKPLVNLIKNKIIIDKNGSLYALSLEVNLPEIYKKEYFNELIEIEFEGHFFKAPVGYKEVLTELYDDYMKLPPEDQRISHHFTKVKFFKSKI